MYFDLASSLMLNHIISGKIFHFIFLLFSYSFTIDNNKVLVSHGSNVLTRMFFKNFIYLIIEF